MLNSIMTTCADPESFARGGPTLTMLFFFLGGGGGGGGGGGDEGREEEGVHRPPRQENADDGPTLNAGW